MFWLVDEMGEGPGVRPQSAQATQCKKSHGIQNYIKNGGNGLKMIYNAV